MYHVYKTNNNPEQQHVLKAPAKTGENRRLCFNLQSTLNSSNTVSLKFLLISESLLISGNTVFFPHFLFVYMQSTLVMSRSKGPSETLRDIRTSTYQMCRIEENTNEQPIFTNDHVI